MQISGSPFTNLEVGPTYSVAAETSAYGQGITIGVAGSDMYYNVQCRDRFGNNATGEEANITVEFVPIFDSNVTFALPTHSENLYADGIVQVKYNAQFAMNYTMHVRLNDTDISGSPFTILISMCYFILLLVILTIVIQFVPRIVTVLLLRRYLGQCVTAKVASAPLEISTLLPSTILLLKLVPSLPSLDLTLVKFLMSLLSFA